MSLGVKQQAKTVANGGLPQTDWPPLPQLPALVKIDPGSQAILEKWWQEVRQVLDAKLAQASKKS